MSREIYEVRTFMDKESEARDLNSKGYAYHQKQQAMINLGLEFAKKYHTATVTYHYNHIPTGDVRIFNSKIVESSFYEYRGAETRYQLVGLEGLI